MGVEGNDLDSKLQIWACSPHFSRFLQFFPDFFENSTKLNLSRVKMADQDTARANLRENDWPTNQRAAFQAFGAKGERVVFESELE